jgi:hypothetical protein
MRATTAAGLKVRGVTLENGVVRLEIDEAATSEAAKANPLDRVLKDAEDAKRPS